MAVILDGVEVENAQIEPDGAPPRRPPVGEQEVVWRRRVRRGAGGEEEEPGGGSTYDERLELSFAERSVRRLIFLPGIFFTRRRRGAAPRVGDPIFEDVVGCCRLPEVLLARTFVWV